VQLVYVASQCTTWCSTNRTQIIAFFVGYFTQDIRLSLYVGLAGTALTFLVIVPPWPFFNKNPEGWLPARMANTTPSSYNINVDGQKVG